MGSEYYYVGVDVGSSSVRCALVNNNGKIITQHTIPITIANPAKDYYEQDSEEIWTAVCACVREVTSGVEDKSKIGGIGFDATCSLVVLDEHFMPVTISPHTGLCRYNIIMWMDHRGSNEAEYINSNNHKVLQYVGGKVSVEMQTPKLLWIKKHMKQTWQKAKYFMDLPDYLTFKASGSLTRSLCSLVCKWTYICDDNMQGWDYEFFNSIGLEDLAKDDWKAIGQDVVSPGSNIGSLTVQAASDMSLCTRTQVAASIIDAHSGALAMLATNANTHKDFTGKLGVICGTSTCHMCISDKPLFVEGIWGPYYSAVIPHYWLNEAGQSATGALIDHIINTHPAANNCPTDKSVYGWIENDILKKLNGDCEDISELCNLTRHIHIYPDYHGNRSPLADPYMKGMISGLTLDSSETSLALLYLATIQALAYGTRQIVEKLKSNGHDINCILICGGLAKSHIFIQSCADVLGMQVLVPECEQLMIVGAAILGAAAAGHYKDTIHAAMAMSSTAKTCQPSNSVKSFHDKKYEVFLKMQNDQKVYRQLMAEKIV